MKKLFSLISVLLCAVMLSTTVYAASPDPLAVYKKYQKNLAKITSAEMFTSEKGIWVNAYGSGMDSENYTQNTAVRVRILANNKLEMEQKLLNSDDGDSSYSYCKNGYRYFQMFGRKYKMKESRDETLSSIGIGLKLTEDIFKNAKIEMLNEGMKITYKMSVRDLPDGHSFSLRKDSENKEQASYSPVTTVAVIGYDGMLKSGSYVVNIKAIGDDGLIDEFKVMQAFKVNSYNSVDAINFPNDLESYELIKGTAS